MKGSLKIMNKTKKEQKITEAKSVETGGIEEEKKEEEEIENVESIHK